jgi:hypothetical protein
MTSRALSSAAVWKTMAAACRDVGAWAWAIAGPASATTAAWAAWHVRGHEWGARPARAACRCWATLVFSFFFLFPNPFLFPISIYTLCTYACIHVLPTYIHPCGVH